MASNPRKAPQTFRFTGFSGPPWKSRTARAVALPLRALVGSLALIGGLSGAFQAGAQTVPTSSDPAEAQPNPPSQSAQPARRPAPRPTIDPASRVHLHRPGTDVDADVLTGSLASQAYIFKGNVSLHSDPTIDREIGATSESDEPLTVTADEIDVDKLGRSYVARGNVHFVQGARSGNADLAQLNEDRHTLDLIGNANVLEGEHRAVASKMHYNTLDKQFAGSGNVRIYEPVPTANPQTLPTPAPKRKRRLPF